MEYDTAEVGIEDPLIKHIYKTVRSSWNHEEVISRYMGTPEDFFSLAANIAFLVHVSRTNFEHTVRLLRTMTPVRRVAVVALKTKHPGGITKIVNVSVDPEADDSTVFEAFVRTVEKMVNAVLRGDRAHYAGAFQ